MKEVFAAFSKEDAEAPTIIAGQMRSFIDKPISLKPVPKIKLPADMKPKTGFRRPIRKTRKLRIIRRPGKGTIKKLRINKPLTLVSGIYLAKGSVGKLYTIMSRKMSKRRNAVNRATYILTWALIVLIFILLVGIMALVFFMLANLGV